MDLTRVTQESTRRTDNESKMNVPQTHETELSEVLLSCYRHKMSIVQSSAVTGRRLTAWNKWQQRKWSPLCIFEMENAAKISFNIGTFRFALFKLYTVTVKWVPGTGEKEDGEATNSVLYIKKLHICMWKTARWKDWTLPASCFSFEKVGTWHKFHGRLLILGRGKKGQSKPRERAKFRNGLVVY